MKKPTWLKQIELENCVGNRGQVNGDLKSMLDFSRASLSLLEKIASHSNSALLQNPRDYIHGEWISEAESILRTYK